MSRDRTLDHTKNFSFTYTEDNGWRLSPAYDLTYSDTYWGEHTTSVSGIGKDITIADLVKVGTVAGGLPRDYCDKTAGDIFTKISEQLSHYLNG